MSKLTRRDFLKASTAVATSVAVGGFLGGCETKASSPVHSDASDKSKAYKVRTVVFSPTGGTMNAAYHMAKKLSDDVEIIDQTSLSDRSEQFTFRSDELVLLAAPCYMKSIPYVKDLFTNLKGDHTPCIVVSAFGNRACENNFAQTKAIAEANGFITIGAISLVTPHVRGARIGHGRPNLEDHKIMQEFADKLLEKLSAGNFNSIPVEPMTDRGEHPHSEDEKIYIEETCVHCGLCAEKCPVGAIDSQTMAIDPNLCISCQRCSYVCPVNARNFIVDRNAVDNKYYSPQSVSYVL